jgi:long-chain acyl-CoA synthetase
VTTAATEPADIAADVHTIADLPFHVMGRVPRPQAVGWCKGGSLEWRSSKDWFERVRDISLGLSAFGMSEGDRVAIMSESRPEWLLSDLAIISAGAVTVPIYPTLSASQARYILQDSGARLVVVSTRAQIDKIQEIRHLLPALEVVIGMDGPAASQASVISLDAVEQRGHARMVTEWGTAKAYRDAARAVRPGQLATIIYTSGTTGEPKGVMLTHANLVANLRSACEVLVVGSEDQALSFLPLSHSFERMVNYIYLYRGVAIAFAESFDTLGRDIALVRPTVFTGVPRVYEKLQARILEKGQTGSAVAATVFRWAMSVALARGRALLEGRSLGALTSLQTGLADALVFSKIRDGVGGRLRIVVSGSAPLAPSVAEFFAGIGLTITEGYGLTETAPILTVNPPAAPRRGSVGIPIPGVEIRIASDGEILARGPNVMAGYLNKPQATADVLKDGWFHTGDIGTLDADGHVRITDRKKDLIVTSGGKKIAPQPVEAVLKRNPLVGETVLLGEARKYAVALIVPDFTALERRLKDLGRPPSESRAELVARGDVLELYQEVVDALNRELSQFERIKRIALLPAEFTVESGELTPTLKVKRKVVEERWKAKIEELYVDR